MVARFGDGLMCSSPYASAAAPVSARHRFFPSSLSDVSLLNPKPKPYITLIPTEAIEKP